MATTATPDKSFIAVSVTSKSTKVKLEYLNRKGKFEYSPTCDTCQHRGRVQDGLNLLSRSALSPTCDRDIKTWRHRTIEYSVPKPCKFFKAKEVALDANV